jgi:hypothetical protein
MPYVLSSSRGLSQLCTLSYEYVLAASSTVALRRGVLLSSTPLSRVLGAVAYELATDSGTGYEPVRELVLLLFLPSLSSSRSPLLLVDAVETTDSARRLPLVVRLLRRFSFSLSPPACEAASLLFPVNLFHIVSRDASPRPSPVLL